MKKLITFLFIFAFVSIAYQSFTNSSGGPAGRSNAPGEGNCTGCHSGSLITSGTVWSDMKLTSNFTGNGYIPDSTYNITIEHKESGRNTWGFQVTCLDSAKDEKAGTLGNGTGSKKVTGTIGGKSRDYITHTSSGTSGSGGRSWTFTWKAPSSNIGPVVFYAVTNAANGSGTGGDRIYAREFQIGPSSLLPTAEATANKTTICAGEEVSFTGSGSGNPTSYSWTFTGGSIGSSTDQNPKVKFSTQGNYTAKLTTRNSKGTSFEDVVNIKVNPAPTAFIMGGSPRMLCKGDSLLLTAQFTAGATYTWSDGQTGSNQVYVKKAGMYSVTVGKGGCERTSPTITVNEYTATTPVLSLSKSITCEGDPIELTVTPTMLDSYYFYSPSTMIGQQIGNKKSANAESGDYYAVVKDGNGCFYSTPVQSMVAFKKLAEPNLSCTNMTTSSVTISWNVISNAAGYEVSIDSGKSWIDNGNNISYTANGLVPEFAREYLIRAKDVAPCNFGEIGKIECTTEPCNSLTVTYDFDPLVCEGSSTTIRLGGLKNSSFSVSLNGGIESTDTSFSVVIQTDSIFRFAITDSSKLNCPAEMKNIEIKAESKMALNLTNELDSFRICDNVGELTFSAQEGFANYTFSVNGNEVQNGSNNELVINDVSSVNEIGVVGNQQVCESAQTEMIEQLTSPTVTFTSSHRGMEVVDFVVTNPEANVTYAWGFNGDFDMADQGETLRKDVSSFNDTVQVICVGTNTDNCVDEAKTTFDISKLAGIGIDISSIINVYPNPVTDKIQIQTNRVSFNSFELINEKGQIVMRGHYPSNHTIQIDDLPNGVYGLVLTGDEIVQKRVVIQRN